MDRLAHFDVSRRFARPGAQVAAQVAFGLAASAAMIAVRTSIDQVAPTVGPFAIVYPTVLIATLYGHWRAGLVAYAVCLLWAWYVVLPVRLSFHFAVTGDSARMMLNAVCAAVVLLLAEIFRRAVARSVKRLGEEITLARVLHEELEHRTRNNFAMIAGLLEIQKRRESAPETVAALDQAIARVHTFADAFEHIAAASNGSEEVAMAQFLPAIVDRLARASFGPNVAIEKAIDDIRLPRGAAVAIGLYINEALTNCAKYAFPGDRPGTVRVSLTGRAEAWTLAVSDDGVGAAGVQGPRRRGGQGEGLLRAFARQARAQHVRELSHAGCHVELRAE
ncbi:sensor histidine kinase [Parablastomonas sp. CN1-191]|uniref:sensor histidine kinase n=1 Tax=Parablastomonas sp. CN1-191 TaxID=3400908 RepID=UPI003BF9056E